MGQLKLVFQGIHVNADGAVSKTELTAALEKDAALENTSLGSPVKEAGLNPNYYALEQLDANADGRVTWEEFKACLKKAAVEEVKTTGVVAAAEATAEEKALAKFKAVFYGIDSNADGAVSKMELSAVLAKDTSLRACITEAGLNPNYYVLEKLDTNRDGRVTWEEFESNLKKAAFQEVLATAEFSAGDNDY